MAKVSVVFPMYNVAPYVGDSVSSIANQTYKDFELVAVNDGSTDNTVEEFRRVVEKYPELKYKLIERANGGLSAARNTALNYATGEWVVFIDSDDVIHPQYLETLLDDAEKYSAELALAIRKKVNAETLHDYSEVGFGTPIEREKLMWLMLERSKFIPYCGCFFIKRDLLIKNNIRFNEKVKFSVDQAFMWQVVDSTTKITLNYSALYNYLDFRPGSIMTNSKIEQILTGLEHYENVAHSLKNAPFSGDAIVNKWKMGVLHTTAYLLDYPQFKEVRKKFHIKYIDCLKVPVAKTKVLSLVGIISERALYAICKKH